MKWRNLNRVERAMLDGELTGDPRNGPITVELREQASAEARASFEAVETNETTNEYVDDDGQFGVGA